MRPGIKPTEKWNLEGLKSVDSKRCASKIWWGVRDVRFKKLDSFTLEMSKNHLIRNFLRNGRLRVNRGFRIIKFGHQKSSSFFDKNPLKFGVSKMSWLTGMSNRFIFFFIFVINWVENHIKCSFQMMSWKLVRFVNGNFRIWVPSQER